MAIPNNNQQLLRVENLSVHFPIAGRLGLKQSRSNVRALDGVGFDVIAGETLGIVGESGCGKSTLARTIVRLIDPTGGQLVFEDVDYTSLNGRALRSIRQHMQMVFQDVRDSLNPRMTVGESIAEPLKILQQCKNATARSRVADLLEQVGLSPADAFKYPHELSGGQRQRIGIARALSVKPRLIVCDEPTSALDVSIQAQVLNLLLDLQTQLGMAYIFISHDLHIVQRMSDRVAVMYLGKIVEMADAKDIFSKAKHPYTLALLEAMPVADPSQRITNPREALVQSSTIEPGGCVYRNRCPIATHVCAKEEPTPIRLSTGKHSHLVACHHVENTGLTQNES